MDCLVLFCGFGDFWGEDVAGVEEGSCVLFWFFKFCHCRKLKIMDGMEKAGKKIITSIHQFSLPTYLKTSPSSTHIFTTPLQ